MEDINLHLLDEHNDWQIVRRPTGIFITGLTKHNVRVDAGRFACNWDGFGIVEKVSDTYLKRKIPQYIHSKLKEFWQSGCSNPYDMYMGESTARRRSGAKRFAIREPRSNTRFRKRIRPRPLRLWSWEKRGVFAFPRSRLRRGAICAKFAAHTRS